MENFVLIAKNDTIKTKSDMRIKCIESTSAFDFFNGCFGTLDIYGVGFSSRAYLKGSMDTLTILIDTLQDIAYDIETRFTSGNYIVEAFSFRKLATKNGKLCIETCFVDTDSFVALYYNEILNPQSILTDLGPTKYEIHNPTYISNILWPILDALDIAY